MNRKKTLFKFVERESDFVIKTWKHEKMIKKTVNRLKDSKRVQDSMRNMN